MTTLLVAATGGHLKQLNLLHQRLPDVDGPFTWVTFDRPQSRSMFNRAASQDVVFVPFIGSRDPVNVTRGLRHARRIIERRNVTAVASTGSAIAIPFILTARSQGIRSLYVESAARTEGPSLTGRIVGCLPGVELYTQYPSWAGQRWLYGGSVFDAFTAAPKAVSGDRLRVVVTVGTLTYGFARLIDAISRALPADAEVLWQLGDNNVPAGATDAHRWMPQDQLSGAMRKADLVIAHAGVGSALSALEAGRAPVLIPRKAAYSEHVDDHQEQVALELDRRGLAVRAEPEELTPALFERAAAIEVRSRGGGPRPDIA